MLNQTNNLSKTSYDVLSFKGSQYEVSNVESFHIYCLLGNKTACRHPRSFYFGTKIYNSFADCQIKQKLGAIVWPIEKLADNDNEGRYF